MKPITKDTPVGTRVLVVRDRYTITRTATRSEPWQLGDGSWVVSVRGISGGFALDRMFLDEPAPGTTAWALEQVAAGYATQRKLYDGIYKRMLIDGQKLVVEWLNAGQPEPDSLDLDDLTATDWEIAK